MYIGFSFMIQHISPSVCKVKNLIYFQDFRRNVKGVNGGQDFDQEMLDEVYNAIK